MLRGEQRKVEFHSGEIDRYAAHGYLTSVGLDPDYRVLRSGRLERVWIVARSAENTCSVRSGARVLFIGPGPALLIRAAARW